MYNTRFDALTRTFGGTASRRATLRAIVGMPITSGLASLGRGVALAKNKNKKKRRRRRKPKPLQRNAFGCVNVGGDCRGKDANCCSGLCQGPVPKHGSQDLSVCVAHNELDCPPGADFCAGNQAACGTQKTACFQTTGEASFCAFALTGMCHACKKDIDCEALQGPGAACIVCANCAATDGTACFAAGA